MDIKTLPLSKEEGDFLSKEAGGFLLKEDEDYRLKQERGSLSKEDEDFLRKCKIHEDKTLTHYFNHHSQLCCSDCIVTFHSECSKLTPILELINTQSTNLHGLSVLLEHLLEEIKSIQSNQGASVQSLKGSYNEHGAFMTEQMRVDIITTIDENQQNIHEEMFTRVLSILNEFDNSIVKTINEIKNEVISIQGSLTSSIHKCIGLQNDLLHFNEIIQKIGDNKELCFIASIKSKHIIQQALIVLGKSDKVLTVKRRSDHKVNIPSDSRTCWITAICVLADGDVLLADFRNDKIKVMNKNYKVVGHCDVYVTPFDMCQITPSEVAVTVGDGKINEVQFFTVKESQLVKCRKLQLHHACTGICHHQGDLFLCSGTALYKYSLCGKLICKLYEDGSAGLTQCLTVFKCAASPTGDKLYITSVYHDMFLTLARDGTILAILTDPDLLVPQGVHVTPVGQVLVCGRWSHNIIQVDSENRRKLGTVATRERDGVWYPESVCFSSTTSSIIVGTGDSNYILVFSVE